MVRSTLLFLYTVLNIAAMKYRLHLLRHRGARLAEKQLMCAEAVVESFDKAGFQVMLAKDFFKPAADPVACLYEPKIVKWSERRIHLLGFEPDGDGAHVQEWVLEEFKLGFGREVEPAKPQSRF